MRGLRCSPNSGRRAWLISAARTCCRPVPVKTRGEWVRSIMARIDPAGYSQATHLLANADLASDLTHFKGRVAVAVGAEDTITPPAACELIAKAANVNLQVIPGAGHAGYIEAPVRYSALIEAFAAQCKQSKGAMQ
jgi:pimeloyl-ACP methyl ester carboxylesterase